VMTSTTQNKSIFSHKLVRKLLVALFWLAIWQTIYLIVKQEILIVSPVRVFQRLFELSQDGAFWIAALNSMSHVLIGFLSGLAVGVGLAVLTTSFRVMYDLFNPVISIIKATPVVSFIILALVWIQSSRVPAFAAFLEVTPIFLGNVTNGIAKTDPRLLQMAYSYRFGAAKTVRRVYIPSIMPYFTAACTTGMGLAWKTSVAAEVLSNTQFSIGGQIYNSKIYIETADLFAWTVVVIVMSVILEKLMVELMKTVGKKYNVNL
jgi:NitT/TauT family transport system permease protein